MDGERDGSPPADDHEAIVEAQRRATFRAVLGAITVLTALLVVGAALQPTPHPESIVAFYGPLFLTYGVSALLYRAKKVRAAAYLTNAVMFCMVTAAVYFFGGLTGQVGSAYFIVVTSSALTLGTGAAFGFTAMIVAACAVIVHLEHAGQLPPAYHPLTSYDHVVSLTATVVLSAYLLKRALVEIESALRRAVRNERENAESLSALRVASDALQRQARREAAVRDLAEHLLTLSDAESMAQCTGESVTRTYPGASTCLLTHAERTLCNATPYDTVPLSHESVTRLHESVGRFQRTTEVTLRDVQGNARRALAVSLLGRVTSYGVLLVFPPGGEARDAELRDFITTIGRVLGSAFERIHAERQLRDSQRLESLGRLAGGIAHDFNNLLTVIMGAGEALRRSPGERERQLGADVVETSRRAADLTQQLLAFARQDGVEVEPIEPDSVIEGLARILTRALGPHVQLELELGASGRRILADRAGLEQVLMNLAVNARDAMPEGGRLRIVTRVSHLPDPELPAARETVILTVEDEGVGMSDEVIARLFEPFYTTKGPGEGTGLGLPTVYGIVVGLGGRVEVESRLGEGTRVRCVFPVGEEAGRRRARRATPSGRTLFGSSA